jgi:hypothetical protein
MILGQHHQCPMAEPIHASKREALARVVRVHLYTNEFDPFLSKGQREARQRK